MPSAAVDQVGLPAKSQFTQFPDLRKTHPVQHKRLIRHIGHRSMELHRRSVPGFRNHFQPEPVRAFLSGHPGSIAANLQAWRKQHAFPSFPGPCRQTICKTGPSVPWTRGMPPFDFFLRESRSRRSRTRKQVLLKQVLSESHG